MKFYKLRFKPTGDFYKPANGYRKSNLSKIGRIYSKKSITYGYVEKIHCEKTLLLERPDIGYDEHWYYKIIKTDPTEWEWVEYETVEINVSVIKID